MLFDFGLCAGNKARWISSELKEPDRLTIIRSPSSSHSKMDPGPIPSFFRTSEGTEICPCAVTFERAVGISHITTVMKLGSACNRECFLAPRAMRALVLGSRCLMFGDPGSCATRGSLPVYRRVSTPDLAGYCPHGNVSRFLHSVSCQAVHLSCRRSRVFLKLGKRALHG